MFTGIVKARGTVRNVTQQPGLSTLSIEMPVEFLQGLEIGASVAVDGVCLSVTRIRNCDVDFDAMLETLRRTALGQLGLGAEVNLERSTRDGQEIGGHPISGHVDTQAEIVAIDTPTNNYVLTFRVNREWLKYIFAKGYLALNGTSLTIAAVDREQAVFSVWLIPETLRVTTWPQKKIGDTVNLEIERGTQVMVDTVRNFLEERLGPVLPKLGIDLLNSIGNNSALTETAKSNK